jgi:hypothetical protein
MADACARSGGRRWAGRGRRQTSALPEGRDGAISGGWSAKGGWFSDPDYDYETRCIPGAAACGIGDVGLVVVTIDKITSLDAQAWFDAWTAVAADLEARADAAAAAEPLRTARLAYLAASEYYTKALVFVDAMADQSVLLPTFKKGRAAWEKAVDASQGAFVRVGVPYEDTALPGYMLRPDASGTARPTLVMTNGSDGTLPALLGYAISQGGHWITRALAFEHRMVAAIADPGAVDVSVTWTSKLSPQQLQLLDTGQKDAFNAITPSPDPESKRTLAFRAKPYGESDPFDLFIELRKYQVRDVVGKITTPLPILNPDDEQFFPGQPKELYDLLAGEKAIIGFSQAQGANFHCQPTGRQLTHTQMLDWLADQLPARS